MRAQKSAMAIVVARCSRRAGSGVASAHATRQSDGLSARESPVGCWGRVTRTGAIRPGQFGEVMISIRGGVEAFYATDVDEGSIDALEEVVVVDYVPPRVVAVARVTGRGGKE